jgi:hypothetical protein
VKTYLIGGSPRHPYSLHIVALTALTDAQTWSFDEPATPDLVFGRCPLCGSHHSCRAALVDQLEAAALGLDLMPDGRAA